MIWNSAPLMTAIDLLIIAVAIYGIWRCRLLIPGRRPSASRIGVWLTVSGLLVVGLFYAADLISMHALPAITSEQEAMELMDTLHRQLSWPVVLLAVITMSTGFVKLLSELQEQEARAQEERERLRQLESDLAHMNRLSVMGELTASLAHEITQPIAAARNNARAAMGFLDRSPPDLSEVREAVECIVADADRAEDIIDRIRDQIKKVPPRKARFDLNEAIDEVIVLARTEITKNGVSVHLTQGLAPVQGDRVQLQQVVLNLILNAVEAMTSVEAGARELLITTEQNQTGDVLVAVRDSGPGIDPKHVERVFEAFYTTKSSGVGMGLSICRSIIEAHQDDCGRARKCPAAPCFNSRCLPAQIPGRDCETVPILKRVHREQSLVPRQKRNLARIDPQRHNRGAVAESPVLALLGSAAASQLLPLSHALQTRCARCEPFSK